jgi:hypothetical protein
MAETGTDETNELRHRLNYLNLRLRNVENYPLTPGRTLWVVLSQTILAAYGFFYLIVGSILWALEGPTEAIAIGQVFINLAVGTLMLLAIVISIMNGVERLWRWV